MDASMNKKLLPLGTTRPAVDGTDNFAAEPKKAASKATPTNPSGTAAVATHQRKAWTIPSRSPPVDEFDADTVEEFARRHRISRAQTYKEIAAGRLIASKVGTRTLILREHSAAWRQALPRIPAVVHASRAKSAPSE
jgi:hypothetical protein